MEIFPPRVGGKVSVVVEVTRSGCQRQRASGDTIYSAGRGLWFVGPDNGNTEYVDTSNCIDCHLFPVSVSRFTKYYYAEFALQLSTFCHVAGNCVSICLNLFYARSFAILLQTSIQNPTILAHESSIKVKHL